MKWLDSSNVHMVTSADKGFLVLNSARRVPVLGGSKNDKFSVLHVLVVFVQANRKKILSTDTNGWLSLCLYRLGMDG